MCKASLLVMMAFIPFVSAAIEMNAKGECVALEEDLSSFHCFGNSGRGIKCIDEETECPRWAGQGECSKNPQYMLINCRKSCESCIGLHIGETQVSPDEETRDQLVQRLLETQEYIHEEAMYRVSTLKKCQNTHKLCTHWAVQGQCENNADFMKEKCAPACQSCRKLF
jgi:prolyl 4-hydroxylase